MLLPLSSPRFCSLASFLFRLSLYVSLLLPITLFPPLILSFRLLLSGLLPLRFFSLSPSSFCALFVVVMGWEISVLLRYKESHNWFHFYQTLEESLCSCGGELIPPGAEMGKTEEEKYTPGIARVGEDVEVFKIRKRR